MSDFKDGELNANINIHSFLKPPWSRVEDLWKRQKPKEPRRQERWQKHQNLRYWKADEWATTNLEYTETLDMKPAMGRLKETQKLVSPDSLWC